MSADQICVNARSDPSAGSRPVGFSHNEKKAMIEFAVFLFYAYLGEKKKRLLS
jgi:hypothetical protein